MIPYAKEKSKTIDDLRRNEYYGIQEILNMNDISNPETNVVIDKVRYIMI